LRRREWGGEALDLLDIALDDDVILITKLILNSWHLAGLEGVSNSQRYLFEQLTYTPMIYPSSAVLMQAIVAVIRFLEVRQFRATG